MNQGDALHFINETFKHAKTIGATNEGVDLLMTSAIKGVNMAGGDGGYQPVVDMGVVTMRNNTDLTNFASEFINAVAQHRHWERQNKQNMIPA